MLPPAIGVSATDGGPRRRVRRTYPDRDPRVFRPWVAKDGALVRLRLLGGRLPSPSLAAVAAIAEAIPDQRIFLTSRANLQLRSLPHVEGRLPDALAERLVATGLVPSPAHDLVRNVIASPLTGRLGGRADLRRTLTALGDLVCADRDLAELPGLFWFNLDDGSGDVAHRGVDVGLVAVDAHTVQIRVGSRLWDEVLELDAAPARMVELASRFQLVRGSGRTALWHVDDLPGDGAEIQDRCHERDPRTRLPVSSPLPFGTLRRDDGRLAVHLPVPHAALDPATAVRLSGFAPLLVLTPWRTVVVPDLAPSAAEQLTACWSSWRAGFG